MCVRLILVSLCLARHRSVSLVRTKRFLLMSCRRISFSLLHFRDFVSCLVGIVMSLERRAPFKLQVTRRSSLIGLDLIGIFVCNVGIDARAGGK